MNIVIAVIQFILWAYTLIILGRFVIDMISVFVPDWKPNALIATIANVIYRLTDPPINLLRKVLPPIPLGSIRLDISLIVILLVIGVIQRIVMQLG